MNKFIETNMFIKVSWLAKNKSGFSEEQILKRYSEAKLGYDGSFTLENQLLGVDKSKVNDLIIWLGTVPIEWYKNDLKVEQDEKERIIKREQERVNRLFRKQEGTRTERRRCKKSSDYLSRNYK